MWTIEEWVKNIGFFLGGVVLSRISPQIYSDFKNYLNDGADKMGLDKNIYALDFEVFTFDDDTTKPVMMGVCGINKDGEIMKDYPKAWHNFKGDKYSGSIIDSGKGGSTRSTNGSCWCYH